MVKELNSVADVLVFLKGEPEVFVVCDKNVEWVFQALNPDLPHLFLEATEGNKTLETAESIGRWLLQQKASRGALLLAIGGGITTDIAGFAAGIYKRGIRYVNLPTTVLAQVDAAIGGKTGVNLDGYKNILGLFHQPEYTFICPEVLKTLPEREYKAGLAELLKTLLLENGNAYEAALSDIQAQKSLGRWIVLAASVKEAIVAEDPYEHGVRAKLNLGHTFAHAIEHEAHKRGEDIHHGEAVAMGIILAARLSEARGIAESGLAKKLAADFASIGLPTTSPYALEELKEAMAKDKKALGGGKVKFVIPVKPGEVVFAELNPNDLHFPTE
ncbi:MAG: 3-dehydroquinate synthase [Bacteroidales bacterium]|nr:3-dehydroquinate synthase [Bacteroidales bacterium]